MPTLAWTTVAKFVRLRPAFSTGLTIAQVFRGAANFHIWAINAAHKAVERNDRHRQERREQGQPSRSSTLDPRGRPLVDADAIVEANDDPPADGNHEESELSSDAESDAALGADTSEGRPHVTVTGREPGLQHHDLVRERVSARGRIRPMEAVDELACLQLPPDRIGLVDGAGPIHSWLAERARYDEEYADLHASLRAQKIKDRRQAEASGFLTRKLTAAGDRPPLTSVAGWHDVASARKVGKAVDEAGRRAHSVALAWWATAAAQKDRSHAEDEQLVDALSQQMADQGVGGATQAVAANAPVAAIREHIAADEPTKLGETVVRAHDDHAEA